jgi:putative heme-binding domain-containing protein
VQVLARQGGFQLITQALADDATAPKIVTALALTGAKNLQESVKQVALDEKRSMAVRSVALRAYGRSSLPQQKEILDWAKAGKIPAELIPVAAEVLFGSPRSEMREEAAKYLQLPGAANAKPLPPIAELAKRTGDPDKGHAVFARTCVACHQINGLGIDFGPALSEIGSKLPKEDLYFSITNPSAAVAFGFEGWILKLKDGNELLGLIASETADEVALKIMGGIVVKYPKSQIVSRTKQDQSLMTPGLHQTMTEQELVDLIEYLTTLKKK